MARLVDSWTLAVSVLIVTVALNETGLYFEMARSAESWTLVVSVLIVPVAVSDTGL